MIVQANADGNIPTGQGDESKGTGVKCGVVEELTPQLYYCSPKGLDLELLKRPLKRP